MAWKKWPYYPVSLTEAVQKRSGVSGEEFVSLIASGCSERTNRPLTLVEPVTANTLAEHEIHSDTLTELSLQFRRIDAINPRQHFEAFCGKFRSINRGDTVCKEFDISKAEFFLNKLDKSCKSQFELYECHNGLLGFAGPVFVANRPVAVLFSGQLIPKGTDCKELAYKAYTKLKNFLPDNIDREDYLKEFTEFAQKLQTCEMFIEKHGDSQNGREPEASFAKILERVALEIGRIVEGEWQAQKRREERRFLNELIGMFYKGERLRNRNDISKRTQSVLNQIKEYCSLRYVVFFTSQPEKISIKPNLNELPFFEEVGVENKQALGHMHVNWHTAELPTHFWISSEKDSEQFETDVKCIATNSPAGRRILKYGLKGGTPELFSEATAFLPVYLSSRYRGLFVLGPFNHLTREEVFNEREFLSELGFTVGVTVFSLLQPADSEVLSAAWSDTAAILAHNARKSLQPVGDAVRILRGFIDHTRTYELRHAKEALSALGASYLHLGAQARKPLEAVAAVAEKAYSFKPCNIEEIINGIIAMYRPFASHKAVRFIIDDTIGKADKFCVDPEKYPLALMNLVDNAVKYSHTGRDVLISTFKREGFYVVVIDDFGLGIDDSESEIIYHRGVQGSRSKLATEEPGEGLGLYHARIIARAHGGDITHTCTCGTRREKSRSLEGYRVKFYLKVPYSRESV